MPQRAETKPPASEGSFVGQLKKTGSNGRTGGGVKYWRWDGSGWVREEGQGWWRPYAELDAEIKA